MIVDTQPHSSIIFFIRIFDYYTMSACSRLADYEQIKRNWLKHEDRLIHIKSTLNTRRPMPKIPSSKKTNFTQTLDVQFENKALLKKLTDRGSQSRQEVSICCQSANPLPKSNRKKYYEDYRIRNQNEGLYKRLKKTKPIIDTQSFKMQRTQTERLLNTISKFGYKNLKPTKTVIKVIVVLFSLIFSIINLNISQGERFY